MQHPDSVPMISPLQHLAADSEPSRGRLHPEPPPAGRTEFQRDRDRIVHATAFRRLLYKTQVFINHEGDLYRTRLTHSLEVAQIARSVARRLGLQEDLTEAICLAHDLGHTPFGHAGQHALNRALRSLDPDGDGFEHNLQSLRVVDGLEKRYAEFDGLNLTFETREGILKHCSPARAARLGPVAARFVGGGSPTLEAQLANIADEVAYNHHDLDDGLRSGLIGFDEVMAVPIVARTHRRVMARHPSIAPDRLVPEMIRTMINDQVDDLVAASLQRVQRSGANSLADVRAHREPLMGFGAEMAEGVRELKAFLLSRLYRHPRVKAMTDAAERVMDDLFHAFVDEAAGSLPVAAQHLRDAADRLASLTDREAMAAHRQRFPQEPSPWPAPPAF